MTATNMKFLSPRYLAIYLCTHIYVDRSQLKPFEQISSLSIGSYYGVSSENAYYLSFKYNKYMAYRKHERPHLRFDRIQKSICKQSIYYIIIIFVIIAISYFAVSIYMNS